MLFDCSTRLHTWARGWVILGLIALLDEESCLGIAGNIEGLLSLYVQDEKNARLSVVKSVSVMIAFQAFIECGMLPSGTVVGSVSAAVLLDKPGILDPLQGSLDL
ncbi:MAG: hypothetical protein KAY32_16890 [Candidatus Eisenbacteria sp.]|nr:hypothetical protein [Candidatus Eisenbacteria bacterium]